MRRADREVRTLRLNFYKKARFANSFKWRLIENGVEPERSERRDSVSDTASLSERQTRRRPHLDGRAGEQPDAGKTDALLARAHAAFAAAD